MAAKKPSKKPSKKVVDEGMSLIDAAQIKRPKRLGRKTGSAK